MKRVSIFLTAAASFLLVEGCWLGGAARRALTGEPPDPVVDGATSPAREALYVTTYAVLRELSGFAVEWLKSRKKTAGEAKP